MVGDKPPGSRKGTDGPQDRGELGKDNGDDPSNSFPEPALCTADKAMEGDKPPADPRRGTDGPQDRGKLGKHNEDDPSGTCEPGQGTCGPQDRGELGKDDGDDPLCSLPGPALSTACEAGEATPINSKNHRRVPN